MLRLFKKIIPSPFLRAYHWALSFLGAVWYRFPSKELVVIGITGTKGKTTVVEIANAILENAGYTTAIISSLRFKIGDDSRLNRMGITMPGRFFIQSFLRKAVQKGCTHVLLEVTSEGVIQHRHKFIQFDIALLNNLAPEHIESHGTFERYRNAKLQLFRALDRSKKLVRTAILNESNDNFSYFHDCIHNSDIQTFNPKSVKAYSDHEGGMKFVYDGNSFSTQLTGNFNVENIIAAISLAQCLNIDIQVMANALKNFSTIPGRLEILQKHPFVVVVDYAHTPASLEAIYKAVRDMQRAGALNLMTNYRKPGARMICVLGGTGGGRDVWKRPVMGKIASDYCDELILTSEDPYDEDPQKIINEIKKGMNERVVGTMDTIDLVDRERAIEVAIEHARNGDMVVITGKGSELWMFVKEGKKIPWSDKEIALGAIEAKKAQ